MLSQILDKPCVRAYLQATDAAFGEDVDYAMLVKIYGQTSEARNVTAQPK